MDSQGSSARSQAISRSLLIDRRLYFHELLRLQSELVELRTGLFTQMQTGRHFRGARCGGKGGVIERPHAASQSARVPSSGAASHRVRHRRPRNKLCALQPTLGVGPGAAGRGDGLLVRGAGLVNVGAGLVVGARLSVTVTNSRLARCRASLSRVAALTSAIVYCRLRWRAARRPATAPGYGRIYPKTRRSRLRYIWLLLGRDTD